MVPQNGKRLSQDARHRTPMSPKRSSPVSTQTATKTSTQLTLSKKSSVIEVRFKEEKFSGAPGQCIDLTLRDFYIRANNQSLTNNERVQLVVSCLKCGALEFYLKEVNQKMPYQIVVDKLRAKYNTSHRNLSL